MPETHIRSTIDPNTRRACGGSQVDITLAAPDELPTCHECLEQIRILVHHWPADVYPKWFMRLYNKLPEHEL